MVGTHSKKPPVRPGKPITDFFTRKPGGSSQPSSSPSKVSQSTFVGQSSRPIKSLFPPRQDQEVISVSSGSHISISSGTRSVITVSESTPPPSGARSRTFMDAVEIVSPLRTARQTSRPQHLAPALKFSRTPEVQFLGASPGQKYTKKLSSEKPRPLGKRKKKFDSDSDVEALDSVIYVGKASARPKPPSSTPNSPISLRTPPLTSKENLTCISPQIRSSSRKRARLSSPGPWVVSDIEELVPSSQSDEQDMGVSRPTKHGTEAVKQKIDIWRKEAPSPSSGGLILTSQRHVSDNQMDVDDVPPARSSRSFSAESETESSAVLNTPPTTPPTTNTSGQLPLPATPIALDAASKTAKIIAQIKAKAYATTLSSPENIPLADFKEELEESSDEDGDELWKPMKEGKGTRPSAPIYRSKADDDLFSVSSASTSRTGRYRLRDHESSSSSLSNYRCASSHSRRSTAVPSRRPNVLEKNRGKGQTRRKVSSVQDPLEILLKEKKLADKRGKGTAALQLAEDAVAGRNLMRSEIDDEERKSVSADWTNESAARMAVKERELMGLKSSCPFATGSVTDGVMLGEEDRQRLFGEKGGKAIVGILESDREKMESAKEKEKVLGVPLWSETDVDNDHPMEVETRIPPLGDTDGHPVLTLLKSAVDDGDIAQASLLLGSSILATIDLTKYDDIIPYLCNLALSPRETAISIPAFNSLVLIWNQSQYPFVGIALPCVLSTLVRLGAKPSVVDAMAWTVGREIRSEDVGAQRRENILYRLVAFVTLSARSGRLSNKDIPDILIMLLLIAIDPSSSVDLQRDIMLAVDAVCQSLTQGTDISTEIESAICTKMLKFTSSLKPINKAHFVSFLAGGSGRTKRIARWVAHSIIVGVDTLTAETYTDLPPLLSLIEQLCPAAEPGPDNTPGIFELHEKVDYVDMGFYVEILSVAISNVDGYVVEEHKYPQPRAAFLRSPGSPSKQATEKAETPLQLIRTAVENLHSKIADTRAAHLDRSRMKAALKRLSMRMYYQRLAALKSGYGTARNIKQYFIPKK